MARAEVGERLRLGVTYWPAAVGPYLWHEYDERAVESDLTQIGARGLQSVRVGLAWDAFMPSPRQVSRPRLRSLEHLLSVASRVGLGVVPVLFGQSLGGDILLPVYAIDSAGARPGVRVVTDGVVQLGGPRDQYSDPLMLEVEAVWLDTLLAAFANHPAIVAWDLGHDPATTMRPRRFGHLQSWVELHADRVRRSGDPVRLTLGAGDLLSARGVRPGLVAPALDALALQIEPQWLPSDQLAGDGDVVVFAAQLAMRLAGEVAVEIETSLAGRRDGDPEAVPGARPDELGWEVALADGPAAARHASETLARLTEVGAGGVHMSSWSDWGARTLAAPPADVRPALTRRGLVDARGEPTALGDRWFGLVAEEPAVRSPQPWPDRLDVEDYYANLPDSARELYAQWRLGRERAEG
ncbi:MAG: hypothetical protein NVSMB29_20090 [Candidatus Dormibacteria bacterium]